MRQYQTLDSVSVDVDNGIFSVSASGAASTLIALRREGDFVALAATFGPLEIALRLRHDALVRTLSRLRPIGGLQTTRELGTARALLAVGLRGDGALVLRPTIVGDASGHVCLNLSVAPDARRQLYDWLGIAVE